MPLKGRDGNAIHGDESAEISALTEKGTPVNADLVIIEDSAASNAKKKVQVGSLPGSSGTQLIQSMCYAEKDKPYVDSSSSSYFVHGRTAFAGTTKMGTPTNIKAIANVTAGTGSMKIYDLTNAATIAENTSITGTTPAIIDLGTLSNLPTGEAIFEIQIKVTTGSFEFSCVSIIW